MAVSFNSRPDRHSAGAHLVVDVLVLGGLLLCVAVFGLDVKIAAGILAMAVVITVGTYRAYRTGTREKGDVPQA